MTLTKEHEKRRIDGFLLLKISKTVFPAYSSPQKFGENIKKCSILIDVPVTYAADSVVVSNKKSINDIWTSYTMTAAKKRRNGKMNSNSCDLKQYVAIVDKQDKITAKKISEWNS